MNHQHRISLQRLLFHLLLLLQTSWTFNSLHIRISRHDSTPSSSRRHRFAAASAATAAKASSEQDNTQSNQDDIEIIDRSTLTLLEHVNFNIPTQELAVPFYYDILGCGVDPRMASNVAPDTTVKENPELFDSTIWANCGASQFHLCLNDHTPATIPGRIGLRYDSLEGLEQRLNDEVLQVLSENGSKQCFQSFIQERDSQGNPQFTIVDRYSNIFVCRQVSNDVLSPSSPIMSLNQPILSKTETGPWKELGEKYGTSESDCRGIDYVEIPVKPKQAEKIAEFYESVFDATANVVPQRPIPGMPDTVSHLNIAMIAVGSILSTGRADQYLLFKEEEQQQQPAHAGASNSIPLLQAGHHHLALYVGESDGDFDQAYKNAEQAGVIWINPRFEDKVDTLAEAQKEKQFRFKNIVDLETGEPMLELEHEIRSINHPSWPGRSQD